VTPARALVVGFNCRPILLIGHEQAFNLGVGDDLFGSREDAYSDTVLAVKTRNAE
jgi:hypothetical protein